MERYFVSLSPSPKQPWGIPNLYALAYRGTRGTEAPISGVRSIASGGYPVNISDASFRQVQAILDVLGQPLGHT